MYIVGTKHNVIALAEISKYLADKFEGDKGE